jgi:hypothetical protein
LQWNHQIGSRFIKDCAILLPKSSGTVGIRLS